MIENAEKIILNTNSKRTYDKKCKNTHTHIHTYIHTHTYTNTHTHTHTHKHTHTHTNIHTQCFIIVKKEKIRKTNNNKRIFTIDCQPDALSV